MTSFGGPTADDTLDSREKSRVRRRQRWRGCGEPGGPEFLWPRKAVAVRDELTAVTWRETEAVVVSSPARPNET